MRDVTAGREPGNAPGSGLAGLRIVHTYRNDMFPLRIVRIDENPGAEGADDVVARLAAAHVRIRSYLLEAQKLADGEGTPERRRASARAVLDFFRFALPLHEADEDASIVPRLYDRTGELTPAALARMEEHGLIDEAVDVLAEDWERWAESGMAPAQNIDAHRALLGDLAAALDRHLRAEERALFPAVAALDAETRREIVREMEERRR